MSKMNQRVIYGALGLAMAFGVISSSSLAAANPVVESLVLIRNAAIEAKQLAARNGTKVSLKTGLNAFATKFYGGNLAAAQTEWLNSGARDYFKACVQSAELAAPSKEELETLESVVESGKWSRPEVYRNAAALVNQGKAVTSSAMVALVTQQRKGSSSVANNAVASLATPRPRIAQGADDLDAEFMSLAFIGEGKEVQKACGGKNDTVCTKLKRNAIRLVNSLKNAAICGIQQTAAKCQALRLAFVEAYLPYKTGKDGYLATRDPSVAFVEEVNTTGLGAKNFMLLLERAIEKLHSGLVGPVLQCFRDGQPATI